MSEIALNRDIADKLRQMAEIIAVTDDKPGRADAYRRGADAVEGLDRSIADILRTDGAMAVDTLPGVGPSIAAAIREIAINGQWLKLQRMRRELAPQQLLATVPGIGAELAAHVYDELGIDRLEDLEAAAYDGRLDAVVGFGDQRVLLVRAALAGILGRVRSAAPNGPEPEVALLLDVDREYRERAGRGELPLFAPRRFNPNDEAWLPVLETTREGWQMTAMFSNTERAHQLQKTRDWVVIRCRIEAHPERLFTVVTEPDDGSPGGQRVVRGRQGDASSRVA